MVHKRPLYIGFSLIEILVVIALLSVLLALLLSSIGRILRSSNQAADMVNLRNLWMACHDFSLEHDNFLIIGLDRKNFFRKNAREDKFRSWMELLQPYLKSASQGNQNPDFLSPGDPSGGGVDKIGPSKTHRSYAINRRTEWSEIPLNSLIIARPDIFVIMGNYDINKAGDSANINGGLSGGSHSLDKVPNEWFGNGTANFLFLDGHVEAIPVADIMPGKNRYYHFNRELNRPENRYLPESGF